jgi:hypothetical protein
MKTKKQKKQKLIAPTISEVFDQIMGGISKEKIEAAFNKTQPVVLSQEEYNELNNTATYLPVTLTTDHAGLKYLIPTTHIDEFDLIVKGCIRNNDQALSRISGLYSRFIVKDFNDKQLHILFTGY